MVSASAAPVSARNAPNQPKKPWITAQSSDLWRLHDTATAMALPDAAFDNDIEALLAKAKGVNTMVGLQARSDPSVMYARDLVAVDVAVPVHDAGHEERAMRIGPERDGTRDALVRRARLAEAVEISFDVLTPRAGAADVGTRRRRTVQDQIAVAGPDLAVACHRLVVEPEVAQGGAEQRRRARRAANARGLFPLEGRTDAGQRGQRLGQFALLLIRAETQRRKKVD